MGVTNGAHTLYHLVNLKRADIAAIARGRHSATNDPEFDMVMPTVDCDSHNVCQVIASKRIADTKSGAVAQFFVDWSLCGIVIAPFVDGDQTSKQ